MNDGIYTVCETCGVLVADHALHEQWHTGTEGAVDGTEPEEA